MALFAAIGLVAAFIFLLYVTAGFGALLWWGVSTNNGLSSKLTSIVIVILLCSAWYAFFKFIPLHITIG